jgi:hypothetical protein
MGRYLPPIWLLKTAGRAACHYLHRIKQTLLSSMFAIEMPQIFLMRICKKTAFCLSTGRRLSQ